MSPSSSDRHNASASANGWRFQYVASFALFLRNIPNVIKFGVEKGDDIDLYTRENHFLGQAKSSLDTDGIWANHWEEIKSSIKTLFDNDSGNPADRLYVVFNFRRPMASDSGHPLEDINTPSEWSFCQLKLNAREKIERYCLKHGLPTEKLGKVCFLFVPFDDKLGNSRENALIEMLRAHLSSISPEAAARTNAVLNSCLNLIEKNAADKKTFITREQVLTHVLCTLIPSLASYEIACSLCGFEGDLEEDAYRYCMTTLFDEASCSYEKYSSVYAEYAVFSRRALIEHRELAKETDVARLYISGLSDRDIDPLFAKYAEARYLDALKLYKLFVAYVLTKKSIFRKVEATF